MQRHQDGTKDQAAIVGDRRTLQQRAEDKFVYWTGQVNWWKRWASDHGLSLEATNSASVHLLFMQELASKAAQEQRDARESKMAAVPPPKAKKLSPEA
ncbi:hypothetical protein JG687_00005762 [Phytophthora cactorum]|uniref:Uncharacterized protein n=1 Tax=Phytophthora cactorum TaxID=29920 RepID=A0A329S0Q9_9STRA|nr:hypothetical protein Pcac1_g10860 [Phytophthora cactorum]KAG2820380.1 hypothetical protein PC112_g11797 [Phytophthora cactorum]KAG2822547.1 hypothetical protein PC111_g10589 [Phytophthora cactorum]KAG2855638.1 hypothetical protein PC113_g12277 [Phytophthora cactorum]KAG2901995.1 hypothetical protein PC114_g12909 [Phytophthora cactorum]